MGIQRKEQPERQYVRREYTSEAGNRIIVERPVLTEQERSDRLRVVAEAAAALIIGKEK